MKIRILLATLAVMALGAPVAASDIGLYVAGSVGQASKDSDRAEFSAFASDIQSFYVFTPSADNRSFDDAASLAFAVTVGYRLTPHLALEGSYARLGEVTHRSQARGTYFVLAAPGTLDTTIESETSGFTIAALGVLPLSRVWELYGRAGALFANNELAVTIVARGDNFVHPAGERFADSFSQSTTDYFAGLGVSRRLFEIYDLRLEYQRFFDVGKFDTGGVGDIDAVFLGLAASF